MSDDTITLRDPDSDRGSEQRHWLADRIGDYLYDHGIGADVLRTGSEFHLAGKLLGAMREAFGGDGAKRRRTPLRYCDRGWKCPADEHRDGCARKKREAELAAASDSVATSPNNGHHPECQDCESGVGCAEACWETDLVSYAPCTYTRCSHRPVNGDTHYHSPTFWGHPVTVVNLHDPDTEQGAEQIERAARALAAESGEETAYELYESLRVRYRVTAETVLDTLRGGGQQ
ncbi:hypothetical protein [Actinopolyspora halophila]|uniref:hypothetical protein n=1 Tax=Actinopolyspora halophila TaxID=1850 RepID=UPI00035E19CC|nr:hypothetical protein [Actinopolyspora halophila]